MTTTTTASASTGKMSLSRPHRFTPAILLARNATLNLLANGWQFLVLLLAMPKLVRYLGETSFGLFSIAWVTIGYLAFLDVGVNRAVTKFISEHLVEGNSVSVAKIVRTGIFANVALGSVGGLGTALMAPLVIHSVFKISGDLQIQARWMFFAVSLSVPILLLQGVFKAVLSSFQRFGWINGIDALVTGAQWFAAAGLAWKGHGVALVVFSTVLVRLAGTVAYGILLAKLVPELRLFRVESLHELTKLLRFGSWVTVSQLISPLLVYLDRVLIGSMVSLGAVTFYTVPVEATARLRIIPSALVGTLYPAFSERCGQDTKSSLVDLYQRSICYLWFLLLPVALFLMVFGKDLLGLWMGKSFAEQTASVLQILALGVLINGIAFVPYNLLQAQGRPDLTGKFHLAEFPLYVGLCVLLIPRWGITGAAIASTLRFTLDAGMLFWAAQHFGGCSLRPFWSGTSLRVLLTALSLAAVLLLIRFSLEVVWGRLTLGLLVSGIAIVISFSLSMSGEDMPRLLRTLIRQSAS